MLLITCPYCGETREEVEFSYAGEALIKRPERDCSDAEWGDYIFNRTNTKGLFLEQWTHTYGCRKVFMLERSTIDNQMTHVTTFEAYKSEQQS